MKKIKELMTAAPQSCRADATIKSVASQMAQSKIGFMPVVDDNKKVIGTVTDRDVTLAIGKSDKEAKDLKVKEVMHKNVQTIEPEADATEALKIMRTKQVGRLPVVDGEQHLTGVVSLMDIARRVKDTPEKETLEHEGEENIVNTFYSLAERNENGI